MSIEVIPAGSSVVVTEKDYARDAERVKDVLATMAAANATAVQNLTQDIKDAEARLQTAAGERFIDTIQDIKDAETRLDRAAGDRFIQLVQDVKEAAKDTAAAAGHTVETVKDVEFQLERSNGQTREDMEKGFRGVEVEMLKQFEQGQKTLLESEMRNLVAFKDQALLSEKLYAAQALLSEKLYAQAAAKAAECCCEIKELVRADGDRTRALINELEHDRLRDKADKAEAALAAYFAAKVSPVIP
jgi:hypothetical protein